MSAAEQMLGLGAVAKWLGISTRGVWRLASDGTLAKPVKVGKCVRWFESDITDYQKRLKEGR